MYPSGFRFVQQSKSRRNGHRYDLGWGTAIFAVVVLVVTAFVLAALGIVVLGIVTASVVVVLVFGIVTALVVVMLVFGIVATLRVAVMPLCQMIIFVILGITLPALVALVAEFSGIAVLVAVFAGVAHFAPSVRKAVVQLALNTPARSVGIAVAAVFAGFAVIAGVAKFSQAVMKTVV